MAAARKLTRPPRVRACTLAGLAGALLCVGQAFADEAAGPPAAAPAPASGTAAAAPEAELPAVPVQASAQRDPQRVQRHIASQPRPQDDAAALLGETPGVNLMNQAGTAGAAVLRGLGMSRLPVLVDGLALEGACNHGMDPATAYVDAGAFDLLTITKGPHSVRHGLALGGSVSFERSLPEAGDPAWARLESSAGAFGRRSAALRGMLNHAQGFVRIDTSHARADDYRAAGEAGLATRTVPSAFERHANSLSVGWRPAAGTLLMAHLAESDGEARYPSYHMDGTAFRRTEHGLRLIVQQPFAALSRLELRASRFGTEHRMDDHSLREPPVLVTDTPPLHLEQRSRLDMDQFLAGHNAALEASLPLAGGELLAGVDGSRTRYTGRNRFWSQTCVSLFGSSTCSSSVADLPFYALTLQRHGLFAEWARAWGSTEARLGARAEHWRTTAEGLYAYTTSPVLVAQSGSGSQRSEHPGSVFARLGQSWPDTTLGHFSAFTALARAQRPADYVERAIFNAALRPAERNVEWTAGGRWRREAWRAELTVFRSRIHHYLQTYQGSQSESIDAQRDGGEAELAWSPPGGWTASGSLTWLHARNLSRGTPLAQTPPAELRLQLQRRMGRFEWGVGARLVARQDRIDPGYGNTIGQDLADPSPGFSVWKLQAAWRPSARVQLSAGIDNLLNRRFAEHIDHTIDTGVATLAEQQRVPQPGRAWWLRLVVDIE